MLIGGAWLWFTDREKAEELAGQAVTAADRIGVATTQAVDQAKPKLEQAKVATTQAADKIHRATTQAIDDVGPYVEKAKAAATQAVEQVRQKLSTVESDKPQ